MKISTLVGFLLIVSAVFFIYALMVSEANDMFGTHSGFDEINSSEWDSQYDMVGAVNATITPLETKFKVITDPEEGFFTKLTAGIAAIPYAIMLVPQVLFNTVYLAGVMIVSFATFLNIPPYIQILVVVMTLVWGIFKLLEYFQRAPV